MLSSDRIRFLVNRFREKLWVKPLLTCMLSIIVVLAAELANGITLPSFIPEISTSSVERLLSIMASSMLVIATLSVSSMVSAYASASNSATPRSFVVVVADDVSQNALSTFIGAFIFSVVALIAVKNGYFEKAGILLLFLLTILTFALVILTFVRWVDRIARLGRVGSTVEKIEKVTAKALERRCVAPTLNGAAITRLGQGAAVFSNHAGYVQQVDIAALQAWAEKTSARVQVAALPGVFASPDRPLAYVDVALDHPDVIDFDKICAAFSIGRERTFDDDPRFGLVVLAEIASRALSPAVNDQGTAIGVIAAMVRLFVLWSDPKQRDKQSEHYYDRVEVPEISVRDMLDDAFTAIARDGAAIVEVAIRLQKALKTLDAIDNGEMAAAAREHARLALLRCAQNMRLNEDLAAVRAAAGLSGTLPPTDTK